VALDEQPITEPGVLLLSTLCRLTPSAKTGMIRRVRVDA
jgi:hypothetical protein